MSIRDNPGALSESEPPSFLMNGEPESGLGLSVVVNQQGESKMAEDKKVWRKKDFLSSWAKHSKFASAKGDPAEVWTAFHLAMDLDCQKSTGRKLNPSILSARLARSTDLLMAEGIKAPPYPVRPTATKQTTADVANELGFGRATAAELKAWKAKKAKS